MECLWYNHRCVVEEATPDEISLLKKILAIDFYHYEGSRRVFEKRENLLFKDSGSYYFPPGMIDFVSEKLEKIGMDLILDDMRSLPHAPINFNPLSEEYEAYEEQVQAVELAREDDNNVGFFSSLMGTGKSRIIRDLTFDKGVKTLIIVPSEIIRDQLAKSFQDLLPHQKVFTKIPKEQEKYIDHRAIIDTSEEVEADSLEKVYLLDKGFKKYGGNWFKVESAKNEVNLRKKKVKLSDLKNNGHIYIICFKSLENASLDFLHSVEMVIVDEGHRAKNKTIRYSLLNMPNAYYRYFFSATMWADLKQDMYLLMSVCEGKCIFEELPKDSIESQKVAKPIYIEKRSPMPNHPVGRWKKDKHGNSKIVYAKGMDNIAKLGLIGNETRNEDIAHTAIEYFFDNRHVLILVNEEYHGHILRNRIISLMKESAPIFVRNFPKEKKESISKNLGIESDDSLIIDYFLNVLNADFIFGQDVRSEKMKKIADLSFGQKACITIGTQAIAEGVDTKNINTIILADLRKASIRNIQGAGRGGRIGNLEDGDNQEFIIVNYMDWFHPTLLKHSQQRGEIIEKIFFSDDSYMKSKWGSL